MFKPTVDNDAFIAKNADQIVNKYGRKTIVICRGKIFTGTKAMERARRKFPGVTPMLFSVPPRGMFKNGFLL